MNGLSDIMENILLKQESSQGLSEYAFYELVLRRINIRSHKRIARLHKIWIDAGVRNTKNGSFDYHSEVETCLDNNDSLFAEAEWMEREESLQVLNGELIKTEEALRLDSSSRLARLIKLFELTDAETDMIHACLALALDPNLERVYAYLQDHKARTYVTEQLVARLFGHGHFMMFSPTSALFTYGLIRVSDGARTEPSKYELDPFIRNWLMGANDIDEELSRISHRQTVLTPLSHWPVTETASLIKKMLARKQQDTLRVLIAGQEGTGRRTFAALVCSQLELPLLTIQTSLRAPADWQRLYMHAQRIAHLNNIALLWQGAMTLENQWPAHINSFGLQFVTGEVEEFCIPGEGMIDLRIELPSIPLNNACDLWKKYIPAAAGWPSTDLEQMIRRQQASIGQLIAVSKRDINSVQEASEALRSAGRLRLGDLAHPINSSFGWNDLVVSDILRKSLDDFYFEATERALVWEQPAAKRLFPQGQGLIAFFTGFPGTGKTMAAQVIANSLQLDIFRVDLSSLVSKYIGETSKNIERILSRARRMDIVLLFDEADALFGKRTDIKDSHDRFANTDTNYLLQAIEDYPGIVILASNRRANVDMAFMRRIRYVLEFPKPDPQQRLQLWKVMLSELCGKKNTAALDTGLVQLAEILEITGAQIKSSILSAIFMARRDKKNISVSHLLRGVERELAKETRGLGRLAQEMLKQENA